MVGCLQNLNILSGYLNLISETHFLFKANGSLHSSLMDDLGSYRSFC